jgi:hypothetical protein
MTKVSSPYGLHVQCDMMCCDVRGGDVTRNICGKSNGPGVS